MILAGVYPARGDEFKMSDALLVALIAILVVFLVLIIIIAACTISQKVLHKIECKTEIKPRPENEILNEDEDAVAAALVATIDFYKETGKDAHLVSITKMED